MAEREPVTIRFPTEVLASARKFKPTGASLNEFVVSAVEREAARRRALAANERILAVRERIRKRVGALPDSTPLIRQLREERSRRG